MRSLGLKFYPIILPLLAVCLFLLYLIISPYGGIQDDLTRMEQDIHQCRQAEKFAHAINRQATAWIQAVLRSSDAGTDAAAAGAEAEEALRRWSPSNRSEMSKSAAEIKSTGRRITELAREGKIPEARQLVIRTLLPQLEKILTPIDRHIGDASERIRHGLNPIVSRIGRLSMFAPGDIEQKSGELGYHLTQLLSAEGFRRYQEQEIRDLSAFLLRVDDGGTDRLTQSQFQTGLALTTWSRWSPDSEDKKKFEAVREHYQKVLSHVNAIQWTGWTQGRTPGVDRLTDELEPLLRETLDPHMNDFLAGKERESALAFARVRTGVRTAGVVTAVVSFSVLLAALLTPLLFTRIFLRPVQSLKAGAQQIGSGNLDHDIPVESRDELGDLAVALNQMVENLKKVTVSRDELSREVDVRKRAQEELERSKEMLVQAQKMEAVGQLAGGVAHEFNNLLFAIIGFVDLSIQQLDENHPSSRYLAEVRGAADRAATLTRRLLAFSRKQVMEPKILSLNPIVAEMEQMLHQLIGENITLRLDLSPALGLTLVDPSQIDQVVMNLVVNARDAMPDGGKMFIETRNIELSEAEVVPEMELRAGSYVLLAVSDSGKGIEADKIGHIFEPFFTTKEVGEGTGLGLAMVYGVVRQSGGDIQVESEPDVGTTFTILLPRVNKKGEPFRTLEKDLGLSRGPETLLLVEDEPIVRRLARRILQEQGYKVLSATNGEEAEDVYRDHQGPIDLLITDVMMPKMNGPQLADRLSELNPEMAVLFMSGHQPDVISREGVSPDNAQLLQKPFSPSELADRVRDLLETGKG